MTRTEVSARLRDWLQDFTGLLHTTADLNNLAEQAQEEVAALTLSYERTVVFTHSDSPLALRPHVREYNIRGTVGQLGLGLTDHLKILQVHVNGVALTRIVPGQYTDIDARPLAAGVPRYYYEFGDVFGIRPFPGAAQLTSYRAEITYAAAVGDWTSGESLLPESSQLLLAPFGYIKARLRERQWQDSGTAFALWFDQLQLAPAVLETVQTRKADLRLAATETQRLKKRSA